MSEEYRLYFTLKAFGLKPQLKTVSKETPPPLPFNLLKLQATCSKLYEYKPDQVKEITQSLRENHKLITYKRYDCKSLSNEDFNEAQDVYNAIVITDTKFTPKFKKSFAFIVKIHGKKDIH